MAELTKDVIDTIIAEAAGDGRDGMTAVAWAIANRAAKGNTTPDAIVKKPKQFEGYSNPGSSARAAQRDQRLRAQVKEIWQGVQDRTIPDPLQGGTVFHASSISPYWASAENKHGTVQIGNQTYYKGGHALPAGELPTVASLTDTVPPRGVAPVTPSIDMAQMRRQAAPSNFLPDTFASVSQPRSSAGLGDRLAMNPIGGGKQTPPPFDAAFDTRTGAMRMLAQPETVSSQGLGMGASPAPIAMPRPRPPTAPPDLISTDMQRIASANPTLLPPVPPSRLGAAAPTPATQSVDLRQSRLPLPNSSPMTRSVASVPVPPTQSLPPLSAPPRRAIPQSFAGMEGSNKTQYGPLDPIPPIAQFDGATVANKGQERLPAGMAAPPALYGGVDPSSVPPMPHPRIARAAVMPPTSFTPQVATQLAVTPPRVAPAPFTRPDFGMGGVDIAEPLTANGVAAPMPMPRLQRGGMFGNPQIMGHDVPLPGIFGLLQGATKGMANSSGPFHNGADNSLYNMFRGGDFNTPGAATVQSGGYLFAPKSGGGWLNVGRANPHLSPQQTYDAANQGAFHQGGGSSGGSGLNTVFDRAFGEARNHN